MQKLQKQHLIVWKPYLEVYNQEEFIERKEFINIKIDVEEREILIINNTLNVLFDKVNKVETISLM